MDEFFYRLRRPALGHFPGSHRSRRGEHGLEYRGHAPLIAAPDARRIDLHASLRDPWEQWFVRVFDERKAVPVYVVADLSGSMGYRGERRKLDVLADFTRALAWSAYRNGDAFAFIGCDDAVRDEWLVPPSRHKGAGLDVSHRLRATRAARVCTRAAGGAPLAAAAAVAGVRRFGLSSGRGAGRRAARFTGAPRARPGRAVGPDRVRATARWPAHGWPIRSPAGAGRCGCDPHCANAGSARERSVKPSCTPVFIGIDWRRCCSTTASMQPPRQRISTDEDVACHCLVRRGRGRQHGRGCG